LLVSTVSKIASESAINELTLRIVEIRARLVREVSARSAQEVGHLANPSAHAPESKLYRRIEEAAYQAVNLVDLVNLSFELLDPCVGITNRRAEANKRGVRSVDDTGVADAVGNPLVVGRRKSIGVTN
jgi:hypothetical protein